MFNDFFKKQCRKIVNNSSIPANLTFETGNRISTFDFSTGNIIKIIKALDPNKAHEHDGISIRMIKLCTITIDIKTFTFLFKKYLKKECFCNEWKKENIVPVTKKEIIN